MIENARMAERLIAKHSDIEHRRNKIIKSINEYEQLRNELKNNRRAIVGPSVGRRPVYID